MPSSTSCSKTRMHTSRHRPHPPFLFGAMVFAAVALLLSRGVLLPQDSPAFSLTAPTGVQILLETGFPNPGVHQFSDGMMLGDVIKLTVGAEALSGQLSPALESREVADGMVLRINDSGGKRRIEQDWMPARQRLALNILLHPDRMSRDDWVTLPGIGEKLAAQIEYDRQIFGDFGRFEALDRVKGIGPAKLKTLQPFFSADPN